MIVTIEAELSEVLRGWTASTIKMYQPRLCCEVSTAVTTAVDLAVGVLRTWLVDLFFVRVTSGRLLLADFPELPRLLGEEFKQDGSVSISRIDTVGGCLFDFSIPEGESADEGELLAVGWGAVEESVREIEKREPAATVFRGN